MNYPIPNCCCKWFTNTKQGKRVQSLNYARSHSWYAVEHMIPPAETLEGRSEENPVHQRHIISEEAAVPRVRGGDRSDQKPQRYSTHTLTLMTQLLILCCYIDNLCTNMIAMVTLISIKLISRYNVVLSARNGVIILFDLLILKQHK